MKSMAGAEQNQSSDSQFQMPGFEGKVVQAESKKRGGSFMDRLFGRQEETVWTEPDPIEPVQEGRQQGFYQSETGEFHLRPQRGDRMIKPKEPKKPKDKRGTSAFAEVQGHEQAIRDNDDGVGTHRFETVNAGELHVVVSRHTMQRSPSGEEGLLFRHTAPPRQKIQPLTDKARRLQFALDAREQERTAKLRSQAGIAHDVRVHTPEPEQDGPVVSPNSVYPGQNEGARWETLRQMVQKAKETLGRK